MRGVTMHCLRAQWNLFCRIKSCYLIMAVYTILCYGYELYLLIRFRALSTAGFDIAGIPNFAIRWALYTFLVFLLVAYEYFSQPRRMGLRETLDCMKISKGRQTVCQAIVMLLLVMLYFLLHFIIIVSFLVLCHTGQMDMEFIQYVLRLYLIYIVMLNCIAVLCGYLISCIHIQLLEYVMLVLAALYFSFRGLQLNDAYAKINGLSDFLQIFPVSKDYTMHLGVLLPVEPHFLWKQAANLCLLLAIASFVWVIRERRYRMTLVTVAMLAGFCVCVDAWNRPVSGPYYGYDRSFAIYEEETAAKVQPEFSVERYQMQLDVDSILKADVVMDLSDSSLSQYDFTLFSTYEIIAVSDGDGNPLSYDRDKNHVIIYNPSADCKSIHLVYEGVGNADFFSGKQGIYLPGNFAYYPMAGYRIENQMYVCALTQQESQYDVTVRYRKPIFSNLEGTANAFHGTSNQLTLIAGYWAEKEIDGISYLYPKYAVESTLDDTNLSGAIQEAVASEMKAGDHYTLQGKQIIYNPIKGMGSMYMFGSDAVILSEANEIRVEYQHYVDTGEYDMDETEALEKRHELWEKGVR